MTNTEAQATAPAAPRRSRRILAGVALVLASLLILLTTVAVWTHQVVLNTDRFTNLAGKVLAEPAVIDPLSARISDQVVTALDVQARLETRLPDAIKPLAGTLTLAVGSAIEQAPPGGAPQSPHPGRPATDAGGDPCRDHQPPP